MLLKERGAGASRWQNFTGIQLNRFEGVWCGGDPLAELGQNFLINSFGGVWRGDVTFAGLWESFVIDTFEGVLREGFALAKRWQIFGRAS